MEKRFSAIVSVARYECVHHWEINGQRAENATRMIILEFEVNMKSVLYAHGRAVIAYKVDLMVKKHTS